MRAGLLTETIKIYRPSISVNQYGEQTTDYVYVATIRARVVSNRNSRESVVDEITYTRRYSMEVRIFQDIRDNDIIEYKNKRYTVGSVDEDKSLQLLRLDLTLINE